MKPIWADDPLRVRWKRSRTLLFAQRLRVDSMLADMQQGIWFGSEAVTGVPVRERQRIYEELRSRRRQGLI